MPYTNMLQHGQFLIDIKPQPLRESSEWTTHFAIYNDVQSAVEPIKNVHMGNICESEAAAHEAGLAEAKRVIESL